MNKKENVSAGAPKIGGYAYRAPLGTTLPTDAITDLDAAFVSLGFISEDGVSNENSPSTQSVKDWSGTTVMDVQEGRSDNWKFVLLETLNTEVLKTVYGDANVTGTLNSGLMVKANAKDLEYYCYAFEMVMRGGIKRRVVLPEAKVTALGEVKYDRKDPIGYEITLSCVQDEDGNTHYDYMSK